MHDRYRAQCLVQKLRTELAGSTSAMDGAGKFHLFVHHLSIFTGTMRLLKENIFPRPNV
jgi:hypothetical protein